MGVAPRMTVDDALPVSSFRACAYLRVSTGRQAESDLSIPDQHKQVAGFCQAKGWPLLAEYVEPGASATDDARPEFQRMIERAKRVDVLLIDAANRVADQIALQMRGEAPPSNIIAFQPRGRRVAPLTAMAA